MKKIFISLCVAILLFNIVSPVLAATKDAYDHQELLQYKGYGQAMYETVVEETTFITGQYTSNKEYVSKTIDQIVDYAKFWKNEASDFIAEDSLRDAIERGGGYLLTVGDWVKKMFGGYGEKYHPPVPGKIYDFTPYVRAVNVSFESETTITTEITKVKLEVDVIQPFNLKFQSSNGAYYPINFEANRKQLLTIHVSAGQQTYKGSTEWEGYGKIIYVSYGTKQYGLYQHSKIFQNMYPTQEAAKTASLDFIRGPLKDEYSSKASDINSVLNTVIDHVNVVPENDMTANVSKPDVIQPSEFDKFREHVDTKINNMATPQPRPYLSCPNGTKIEMSISGSTFLGVDGKVLIVNKDGTAEIDSAICQLGWDKPPIKYIDDRAAIQTPDGKWQDAETGETVQGSGEEEEEGEDGECGMLCSLGKLSKFLLDFFKNLLDFFIKIFVPEDMDFVTEEFDKIKNNFDDKLGIVGDLTGTIENFFAQENSNPLADLTINLPATGGETFDVIPESSLIEQHVPTVKKVMSGILVIMTVFYIYRKITGRGGVMEK